MNIMDENDFITTRFNGQLFNNHILCARIHEDMKIILLVDESEDLSKTHSFASILDIKFF